MNKNPLRPITKRKFAFQRFGSSYHLKINSVDDILQLLDLDEAHWVATNAPIDTINADSTFLNRLDNDSDTRVRAAEVKDAISWTLSVLKSYGGIHENSEILDLAAIDSSHEDGETILETSQKILARLHVEQRSSITLHQIRSIKRKEQEGGLDKAGVVLSGAASSEDEKKLIRDILNTIGGDTHPGGKTGITNDGLEQFLKEAEQLENWRKQADVSTSETTDIMPLGKETSEAYDVYRKLHDKIEQYFSLCNLIRLNPEAERFIYADDKELNALNVYDNSALKHHLELSAISPPNKKATLEFKEPLNPVYAEDLLTFKKLVFSTMTDNKTNQMTLTDWKKIQNTFSAHEEWQTNCPETKLHVLERNAVQKYVTDEEFIKGIRKLIQESHRTAFVLDNIRMVEKLLLFQAHLLPFVNSFVSFPDLYDSKSRALFEMGTLIMDGRHFTLCVKVNDRKQHAEYSSRSNMFVLYAEISTGTGEKLYEIAVPVTTGNRGNLQANKWGIFQDLDGIERHARILQIVENPISLTEAVIAPFRRLGRAITSKLEDITQKAQTTLEKDGATALVNAKPPEKSAEASGGMLAGGGIAIAALGSSVAFITKTLAGLGWLELVGGLAALLAAVIVPATIVAFLKLRSRDISSILEGSGWGINARMRLTRKQAKTFTHIPAYPANSTGIGYRSWWVLPLLILIVAAIAYWKMYY
ncbi:MAG: hypothetical protein ACRBF0_04880 [Calditrichia bacterium]